MPHSSLSPVDRCSDTALDRMQAQARYYFQPTEFADLTGRPPRSVPH